MTLNKQGLFITIEGIEGVGKSSNVHFITQLIQKAGIEVVVTREPGGTPIAEDIRKILLKQYDEKTHPQTELLLLYAGRLQHVEEVIKPALSQGKWVLCDRFNDATFAYQGAGRNVPMDEIEILDQWVLKYFTPDLTLILDATVEIAMARIKHHRELDRFEREKQDFFERIRKEYLQRAKRNPDRYRVVDATQPLANVQQAIQNIFQVLMAHT